MDELVKKYLKPEEDGTVKFTTGFQLRYGAKKEAVECLERSIHSWKRTAEKHIDHINGVKHEKSCIDCAQEK